MVRGKIQMKRIENATSRQVTFSKRRNGLLKKAYELSVLCDAEVAVIIFSQRGKVYEFSSSDMQKTIERYHKYIKEVQAAKPRMEQYVEQLKLEAANMVNKIEQLEVSKRKLLGQGLGLSSRLELEEVFNQLERSLAKIRARKDQLFKEQIEQLKAKEKSLLEDNAKLAAQCGELRLQASTQQKEATVTYNCSQSSQSSDQSEQLKLEAAKMVKKIDQLKASIRLGQRRLNLSSRLDLEEISSQLKRGWNDINAIKDQLIKEEIEQKKKYSSITGRRE
ncbi:Transcription factor, MADS-box [Corchorus capsularis]|uniref:Transcription factor, MADS-box n=1 Tax=Corchorus capsularis TaxID=210143 RepID=A0A1R3ITS8_COCAP|nr:Transcription factor, MADS-box [Corchorus capsularis]